MEEHWAFTCQYCSRSKWIRPGRPNFEALLKIEMNRGVARGKVENGVWCGDVDGSPRKGEIDDYWQGSRTRWQMVRHDVMPDMLERSFHAWFGLAKRRNRCGSWLRDHGVSTPWSSMERDTAYGHWRSSLSPVRSTDEVVPMVASQTEIRATTCWWWEAHKGCVVVVVERREGGGDGGCGGGVGAKAKRQSKSTQLHALITENGGRSKDLACVTDYLC
jgi:hypothetical protein